MATEEDNPVFDNSGTYVLKVPGFGLPVDFQPGGEVWGDARDVGFVHGANDFHPNRMTVREVAMLRFLEAITEKPDWNIKVFNEEIVNKWRDEAIAASSTAISDGLISEKAVEWCIRELRDKAKDFEKEGFVRTLESGSRCVKSDGIISRELNKALKNAVEPLLNVDAEKKDFHPNSNDQVLNLVHPSLYPLIYGKTRVLSTGQVGLLNCMDSCGKGEIAEADQDIEEHRPGNSLVRIKNKTLWSNHFQWLPTEVKFQGDEGTDVKITSYINNLYPAHNKELYNVIEKFISKVVPLWNEVLFHGSNGVPIRITTIEAEVDPIDIPVWAGGYKQKPKATGRGRPSWPKFEDEGILDKVKEYLALPNDPAWQSREYGDDLSLFQGDELPENWEQHPNWSVRRVVNWKYKQIRKVIHPEPGNEFDYISWKEDYESKGFIVRLEEQFRSQGLQVIPKLSSIELTPDNPSYPGGSWHLEGMLNEHIVATAIYYYDVQNVTPSHLRFRQEAWLDDEDLKYEQDDHDPLSQIFGTNSMRNEPAVQEVGSIATTNGRLLAFPNTLQHKVEPFTLLDANKPGHRRFLVLWLVDPHYRIVSTANVPPQQIEWNGAMTEGWEHKLPEELAEMVRNYALKGQISLKEAKEVRLELMKERTTFGETVESNFDTYNLCEH